MNPLIQHPVLACMSFCKKFISGYFTTLNIIKGFFIAFFLSLFIFLEHFHLNFYGFGAIFTFLAFGYLATQTKEIFFWSGVFVGLFWFYWISFSLIHYGFWYLLPFGLIFVCFLSSLLFLASGVFFKNPWIKGALLLLITLFVHPFGFNWLDFRISLLHSPFRVDYVGMFLFVFASISLFTCPKKWKIVSLLPLCLALNFHHPKVDKLPFSVQLMQTDISQDDKWKQSLRQHFVDENIQKIKQAIKNKKRAIIFPESAFPLYVNMSKNLTTYLKKRSFDIAIITGALTYKDGKYFNSTYLFDKGQMRIINKVVLVPFGEKIPLPAFMARWINEIFFDGAEDFSTAKEPQDYLIDGVKIRNAICFEATTPLLYEKKPKFMIALSNNAWFTPSTEPTLQKLLLELFATLNNTTIYHSVNGSHSEIITPQKSAISLEVLSNL